MSNGFNDNPYNNPFFNMPSNAMFQNMFLNNMDQLNQNNNLNTMNPINDSQINWIGLTQLNTINQIKMMNQINKLNQDNQIILMNQNALWNHMNNLNQMNQMNQGNQMNMMTQIDKLGASNQINNSMNNGNKGVDNYEFIKKENNYLICSGEDGKQIKVKVPPSLFGKETTPQMITFDKENQNKNRNILNIDSKILENNNNYKNILIEWLKMPNNRATNIKNI